MTCHLLAKHDMIRRWFRNHFVSIPLVLLILVMGEYWIFYQQWWLFGLFILLIILQLAYGTTKSIWYLSLLLAGVLLVFLVNNTIAHHTYQTNGLIQGTIVEEHSRYLILRIGWGQKVYLPRTWEDRWHLGDQLWLQGRVGLLQLSSSGFGFNFTNYLHTNGVYTQFEVRGVISLSKNNAWWRSLMVTWVNINVIGDHGLVANQFLKLILFTELDEQTTDLYYQFINLNLIHLLIISGYHINLLTRKLQLILQKWTGVQWARVIVMIVLCVYWFLLNFKLTAFKAIILVAIRIVFSNNKWQTTFHQPYNQIFLSGYLILLVYRYGFFQSSLVYGFTITIIVRYCFRFMNHVVWWKRYLWFNLLLYLATLGWNWYYNYVVNFSAFLFNLFLAPLLGIIYMINLILLIIPWLRGFDYYLFYFLTFLNNGLLYLNFCWRLGAINLVVPVGYYCLLGLVLHWRVRFFAIFISAVSTMALSIWFIKWLMVPLCTITMLNVGDANSIIIQERYCNETFLYDAGAGRGVSKMYTSNYLKWRGIQWVNAAYISHHHADHYNQLTNLYKTNWILHTIDNHTSQNYFQLGWIKAQVLNRYENYNDENDNSLVLLLAIGSYHALLTGDMSSNIEQLLLDNYQLPKIDLLQVSHHGSQTASSWAFLKKIQPKTCFISAAHDGVENFPDPITTDRLSTLHCHTFITEKLGNLQWIYNGPGNIKINAF